MNWSSACPVSPCAAGQLLAAFTGDELKEYAIAVSILLLRGFLSYYKLSVTNLNRIRFG